ncbi:MAG: hypothetical protein ACOX6S_15130 [Clostridia bacterium]
MIRVHFDEKGTPKWVFPGRGTFFFAILLLQPMAYDLLGLSCLEAWGNNGLVEIR